MSSQLPLQITLKGGWVVSGAEVSSGPIAMLELTKPRLRSETPTGEHAFVRIDLGKQVLLDRLPTEAAEEPWALTDLGKRAALQIVRMLANAVRSGR